jgi:uncharacterized protein YbaR (Trm112 family)
MDKHLLDILCCPQTKTPVRAARRDEIDALNRAIATGELVTVAGKAVQASFPDALITRDGKTVYRIEDDIPVMLADEAVSTTQLSDFPR